ncbi:YwgA family protein [Caldibacillus lycopersici]|uniref:YwgA family protein n=1 Tax=Perspicuibacillus lycopersici TaxID=1325689 RepID=A0AAE3IRM7_9BACI|nr:YwgA family protein [Perspicuibacillus lycopersici]MCU9613343.1 YwgA family protein [Perspicuibacillus lycopersici]
MLLEHAKILHAIQSSGEIIGRKKFQKMIYIAKKLAFPFQEKFQFHFYGPYSEELTLQLEELVNMGLINEIKEKKGGYYQYRYTVTENGEDFIHMFDEEVHHPKLNECLTDMNEQSSRFLELVSTVLYFDTLPKEQVYDKISQVKSKQKYTREEIDQAFAYIDSLKEKVSLQVQ